MPGHHIQCPGARPMHRFPQNCTRRLLCHCYSCFTHRIVYVPSSPYTGLLPAYEHSDGALITTRYLNQLKSEKRMAKAGLVAGPEGYKMVPNAKYMRLSGHHSHNFSLSTPTSTTLVGESPYSQPRAFTPTGSSYVRSGHTSYAASVKSFNPYEELQDEQPLAGRADEQPLAGSSSMPVPYESIEAGYGGMADSTFT